MTLTEVPRSAPADVPPTGEAPAQVESPPAKIRAKIRAEANVRAGNETGNEAQRLVGPGPRHAAQRALLERNRALKLIDTGRATTAAVCAVRDTGLRVNGRPVAEVHLLIERPGAWGNVYPVVRSTVLPDPDVDLSEAATASSGRPRRIPVLVDPHRPENVLLGWDLRPAS
ncbi:hypothetical protein CcI156_12490 [Frankia sp. CcI156]|jgi:hypothetical protein|uniref:Uncharacterized protein n=1 Tax=Frankia casuarinae (strain DSM 45818 / CECT 9043 / HFP020203 / CcI3) TaxID=106370 RepID=A0A1X1PS44_FRACC|nr:MULTISPECIES: hypothetical protein [Frankia]ABD10295.1 hypothetical protein Francci3_0911 [Frankia casuarinae]ETA01949.1 hypothetical protein CcI6DRAFT_02634 [Frankia sp. CcI6]EYT92604.1 hypothetical protein ThrDRAFT_01723 [Frankia casuarinae]KDA43392.1 hypothetical protein BMG523Draft_01709 [Frankia sp. BMG5.23]KEZ38365.1 hypothetical protein CEDDRAFT_00101 [Frankia sp. CeD]